MSVGPLHSCSCPRWTPTKYLVDEQMVGQLIERYTLDVKKLDVAMTEGDDVHWTRDSMKDRIKCAQFILDCTLFRL